MKHELIKLCLKKKKKSSNGGLELTQPQFNPMKSSIESVPVSIHQNQFFSLEFQYIMIFV